MLEVKDHHKELKRAVNDEKLEEMIEVLKVGMK